MGIVWELNTVMCKKYLAQGLTFPIWSTSCVHEEEVNDEEDDDNNEDDGDNDADDDQHLSHNGKAIVGNGHAIYPRFYCEFSRG